MFRALVRRARPRSGLARLGPGLFVLALCAGPARAQGVPPALVNHGVRWIGSAATCQAPDGWAARRLFRSPAPGSELGRLCVYRWDLAGTLPAQSDLTGLFAASGAGDLTEDVPVVLESAAFTAPEIALLSGLRAALSAQVGDATLLPHPPGQKTPVARIVVIDSAPDARHGQILPGASRHGDTLAHLIEDLVCLPATPSGRPCAAEVTTALALDGGVGTLSDLAGAIERAVVLWQSGRSLVPASTPAQLILNLSLGWEDQPGFAECSTDPRSSALPVRAVAGILQYAAAQGALIIAAAGNDSGGPRPRTGLVCPGRYQAVPRDTDPRQSLVVAVSGVDYRDRPLDNARPLGITGIAALGFGGVAWNPADPVPPALTGSSVSTAVTAAVSALVWSQQASWNAAQVTRAVHSGGVAVGAASECPLAIPGCGSRRASVCGALHAAGVAVPCSPAAPYPGSNPGLPAEITAFGAAFGSLPPTVGTAAPTAAPLPRDTVPTVQVQPWIYPMPIAETCPVCVVANAALLMPALTRPIADTVLVVRYADGTEQHVALAPPVPTTPPTLASGTPYSFALPAPLSPSAGPIVAAYLTARALPPALPPYSITEPLFVEP